jgi:hypothetical protein
LIKEQRSRSNKNQLHKNSEENKMDERQQEADKIKQQANKCFAGLLEFLFYDLLGQL